MKRLCLMGTALLLGTILFTTGHAAAQNRTVMGSGGGTAANGSFIMHSTVGQAIAGYTDGSGLPGHFGFWVPSGTATISALDNGTRTGRAGLRTCLPNPLQDRGILTFSPPESGTLSVVLYDDLGQFVEEIFSGHGEKGTEYRVPIKITDLSSGHYRVILISGMFRDELPLFVIK